MFRRTVLWSVIAIYLIVIGLWSSAVAPLVLATAGLAVVIGAIPAPVLALAAAVIWLKHRRPAPTATA